MVERSLCINSYLLFSKERTKPGFQRSVSEKNKGDWLCRQMTPPRCLNPFPFDNPCHTYKTSYGSRKLNKRCFTSNDMLTSNLENCCNIIFKLFTCDKYKMFCGYSRDIIQGDDALICIAIVMLTWPTLIHATRWSCSRPPADSNDC